MIDDAQYFVRRDAAGRPVAVLRIRRTVEGIYPESFHRGGWQPDGAVMSLWFDRDASEHATAAQAREAAARLSAGFGSAA